MLPPVDTGELGVDGGAVVATGAVLGGAVAAAERPGSSLATTPKITATAVTAPVAVQRKARWVRAMAAVRWSIMGAR
jgi:hypothetical protein